MSGEYVLGLQECSEKGMMGDMAERMAGLLMGTRQGQNPLVSPARQVDARRHLGKMLCAHLDDIKWVKP